MFNQAIVRVWKKYEILYNGIKELKLLTEIPFHQPVCI